MAVGIDGSGPITGATTLSGLTIPTTGFGKVLQVVFATQATNISSTDTSFADTGLSVSITPHSTSSTIILFYSANCSPASGTMDLQITDSSNGTLTGAENVRGASGTTYQSVAFASHSPASTSSQTYKLRYKAGAGATARIYGASNGTTVLCAIEVGP